MTDYLKSREREKQLEKIRGKATTRKPSVPTLRLIKLARTYVYPLDEQPAADVEPRKLSRSTKLRWVDGFAVVSMSAATGPRYLGYLDYDSKRGDFTWWRPDGRFGVFYPTLRDAVSEESPLAKMDTTDKQWAELERAEAKVRKENA